MRMENAPGSLGDAQRPIEKLGRFDIPALLEQIDPQGLEIIFTAHVVFIILLVPLQFDRTTQHGFGFTLPPLPVAERGQHAERSGEMRPMQFRTVFVDIDCPHRQYLGLGGSLSAVVASTDGQPVRGMRGFEMIQTMLGFGCGESLTEVFNGWAVAR